jgi:hypothetical protein
MKCPMEAMVRRSLKDAGITFVEGDANAHRLDFDLPEFGLAIEVKRYHSERISEQMSRTPNVIVLQGEAAIRFFCEALTEATFNSRAR